MLCLHQVPSRATADVDSGPAGQAEQALELEDKDDSDVELGILEPHQTELSTGNRIASNMERNENICEYSIQDKSRKFVRDVSFHFKAWLCMHEVHGCLHEWGWRSLLCPRLPGCVPLDLDESDEWFPKIQSIEFNKLGFDIKGF